MNEPVKFESREVKLNRAIEAEVDKIRVGSDYELPKIDATIVGHFVQKIEGTYDVGRAKKDTDNAIDLLYIAYNTTPQEEGDIRVKISAIMDKLIKAQQESERTMKGALRVADNILGALSDIFPDWLDVRGIDVEDTNRAEEIKGFVGNDLLKLANEIKDKAAAVQSDLNGIAATYDSIIRDTVSATSTSEKALSTRLKIKAALEKEIVEANAKREQLESLVKDLQREVDKFEKMARGYESRAETAEERAFVMSIVQVGAQMISAAIPAIAMAAGGPGSFLAASTLNTVSQATATKDGGTKDGGTEVDNTAEVIRTKTEISEKQAELKASEAKKDELKTRIKGLEAEKAKLLAAATEIKSEAGAEDATTQESDDTEETPAVETQAVSSSSVEVAELDKRIEAAKAELKTEEDKFSALGAGLAGLQSALGALDKNLSKMTDEQQAQATSLREMQMKMLDKVEAYEREKRDQAAELVKISALLKGKRTEEETIQLAIKSLNLSLSALKRAKEIVEEIAFFFKSFADFMGQVVDEATQQVESIEKRANKTLRERALAQVILSTDGFFIRQSGEWNAVTIVCDKFARNFADGWSKLNKLNGTYITGDELGIYLETASVKLTSIATEREQAADRKIADLDGYRAQIRASAEG